MKKTDGPFPYKTDFEQHEGVTIRDYFAIHAPEPSQGEIEREQKYDRARNPHNDGPPKPRIRSESEIRADLRYDFADIMLATRERP